MDQTSRSVHDSFTKLLAILGMVCTLNFWSDDLNNPTAPTLAQTTGDKLPDNLKQALRELRDILKNESAKSEEAEEIVRLLTDVVDNDSREAFQKLQSILQEDEGRPL